MQVTRPVFPARQLIAWGAKQPERTEMADGNRGRPTRCGLRRRIWLELGDRVERGAWGCAPERGASEGLITCLAREPAPMETR